MKRLLIIWFSIFAIVLSSYAQMGLDIVKRFELDTASVFLEMRSRLANDDKLSGRTDLTICPVYKFIDDKWHSKDSYLDYSFLDTFEPCYSHPVRYSKWRAFWSWITGKNGWVVDEKRELLDFYEYKVYDSLGLVVGSGPYRGDGCISYKKNPMDTLVEYKWKTPPDLLFDGRMDYLMAVLRTRPEEGYSGSNVFYYYGINLPENRVYIIIPGYFEVRMYTLEEIVNDYWDDFKVGLPQLVKQVRKESALKWGIE